MICLKCKFKPICPIHKCFMKKTEGEYGKFYFCPKLSEQAVECEIRATFSEWDKYYHLSDAETRKSRQEAHAAFDPIWKQLGIPRATCYRWLNKMMKLTSKECHIQHFSVKQCKLVIDLLKSDSDLSELLKDGLPLYRNLNEKHTRV